MQIIWLHPRSTEPEPLWRWASGVTLKFKNHQIQDITLPLAGTMCEFQHHNSIPNVSGNLGELKKKKKQKKLIQVYGNMYLWNKMLHLWQ